MGSVLHTKLHKIAFKFKVQFISNGIKLKLAALAHTDTYALVMCVSVSGVRNRIPLRMIHKSVVTSNVQIYFDTVYKIKYGHIIFISLPVLGGEGCNKHFILSLSV